MPVIDELEHYGVKGMRWGVRRYKSRSSRAGALTRKVGRALIVGDEKKSLATARGRSNFKKNIEADVKKGKRLLSKILKNKAFTSLIYNHAGTKKNLKAGKEAVKKAHRKFLKKSLAAHKKDYADLKKHGFNEEAKGLKANIDALEKKLAS
jgi:hypothetical protein